MNFAELYIKSLILPLLGLSHGVMVRVLDVSTLDLVGVGVTMEYILGYWVRTLDEGIVLPSFFILFSLPKIFLIDKTLGT